MIVKPLLYALLFVSLFFSCQKENGEIENIILTKNGRVKGAYDSTKEVYSYKGIPYAQPPIDSLRWRPPSPVKNWEGVLDATTFGAICMQPSPQPFMMWTQEFMAPADTICEECLTLNIWTKKGVSNSGRPVIVFIHGGGFLGGAGAVPIYDGTNMASKGVVFVTINYRLGIFGFLATPQLMEESARHTSGNYGILDQIEAVKWVKKNIASFGGDPDNITIAGQSVGTIGVSCLVASPLAKGLFEHAIAESGAAFNRLGKLSKAANKGREVVNKWGNDIAGLREISADSLLRIQNEVSSFGSVIDGYVLPESIRQSFKTGIYNNVPVLTGWNEVDGNFLSSDINARNFQKAVKKEYGKNADSILQFFPADNDSMAYHSQIELHTLRHFGLQSWKWMKAQGRAGGENVYVYCFTRNLPYTKSEKDYGAFHTGEIPYAYHNLGESNRPWSEMDYKLEKMMSSYWINFSRTGNPNGKGLPKWPKCDDHNNYKMMVLGATVVSIGSPVKQRLHALIEYNQ